MAASLLPCPSCGFSINVDFKPAGTSVICPKCFKTSRLGQIASPSGPKLALFMGAAPSRAIPAPAAASPRRSGLSAVLPAINRKSPVMALAIVSLVVSGLALTVMIAAVGWFLTAGRRAVAIPPTVAVTPPIVDAILPPEEIVKLVNPSVCFIGVDGGISSSSGSGFVVGRQLVATNDHVVGLRDVGKIELKFVKQGNATFARPRMAYAVPDRDLVILYVPDLPAAYKPLQPVNSANVPQGSTLIVFGSPLGEDNMVSPALMGGIKHEDQEDWLRIAGAINPGNSGGPAVTNRGLVAGIITAKRTDGESIGYAIPGEVLQDALAHFTKLDAAGLKQNVLNWRARQVAGKAWLGCGVVEVLLNRIRERKIEPRRAADIVRLLDDYGINGADELKKLRADGLTDDQLKDLADLCATELELRRAISNDSVRRRADGLFRDAVRQREAVDKRFGKLSPMNPDNFIRAAVSKLGS